MGDRICTRCVMDTTDPNITFDGSGICNHCHNYERVVKERVFTGEEGDRKLRELVQRIKQAGRGKKYDCLLGLSGGVDSSYLACISKQLDLRVLLLTCDNGFDPTITSQNVHNIAKSLGLPLEKFRFNQEEFNDLWLSFFRAGVINIEAVTDHLMRATLYEVAEREGLKYILTGSNSVTEITMPPAWGWDNNDRANLLGIHRAYGKVPIRTLPLLGHNKGLYYELIKGIRSVSPLNYVNYVRTQAKRTLVETCGYQDYGSKHRESVLTRFYQGYILPQRWGIDKRKAHLSCLIVSGQMSRQEALEELKQPPYKPEESEEDKKIILRTLGIDETELRRLMTLPKRRHEEFGTDSRNNPMIGLIRRLRGSRH